MPMLPPESDPYVASACWSSWDKTHKMLTLLDLFFWKSTYDCLSSGIDDFFCYTMNKFT